MDETLVKSFETMILGMIGKTCWSVQMSGVGSLANLQIGEKVKRAQPLLHQDFKLSMEERAYIGEYVLYLEECPWRLETAEAVVCTWMDESTPDGQMNTGLKQVIDRQVERAEITRPALDLTLYFTGHYVLRVFPDQVDPDEGDNYSITHNETATYVIAADSTLYIE
jgi:hypothetical protein